METTIQRMLGAVRKNLKESSKKHTALRKASQDAIDYMLKIVPDDQAPKDSSTPANSANTPFQSSIKLNASGLPADPEELDKLSNLLVNAFRHACETRTTKLMTTGLDSLQKMIDYGYIRGAALDDENPGRRLTTKVVSTISSCFDYPDDGVQLQIIKAFLSLVSSSVCDIHETALLNAIRTCYNIYLVTRHPVNQNTAKGILTQMINVIFQRMELKMSPDVVIGVDEGFDEEQLEKSIEKEVAEAKQLAVSKSQDIQVESNGDSHKETPETPEMFSKNLILNIVSSIEGKPVEEKKQLPPPMKESGHFVFTDCYLVFRALCKLSMKDVPKEATPDSIDMKSKILSLDLLYTILENSGPVFRSFDKFINSAIKKYLIISLLTNGVSSNLKVFKLSLQIFLALVAHFKDYLKNEIGVLYSKIFLVILESANSSTSQKLLVLQALHQICKNPQALVDIYINYDCSLEHIDVYERMVNDLSRLATAWNPENSNTGHNEVLLQTLNCLVTIMKSLVDWCKDLRIELSPEEKEKEQEEQREREKNDSEHDTSVTHDDDNNTKSPDGTKTPDPKALPNFQETKQFKMKFQQAVQRFNMHPKKGMRYLIEKGFVENTPEAIAAFLRNTEGLDKKNIGDYLGDRDEFHKKAMHSYVDTFDFTGLEIDKALRRFLGAFRIPGEAQAIDRFMEKFAERYYAQNPNGLFASADSVYILAFATIMLATDQHSPSVKVKMTKDQWIQLQSKNNDGKDFEKKMLSELFDRISAEEIKLNDAPMTVNNDLTTDPKLRRERFQEEMERTIAKSKQIIKERSKDNSTYYRSKQIEHVKPMFEIASFPTLAALSVLLEHSDDNEVITLCFDGFKYAIRVSCTFFMEVQRNTFVTSLAKFTFLNNLREMKQKNIESIKALMAIARSEANYLQDSWFPILQCISHLEQLQLLGSGASPYQPDEDEDLKSKRDLTKKNSSIGLSIMGKKMSMGSSSQFSVFELQNSQAISEQIDLFAIDKIFTSSIHLSNNAIEDFVKCLCQVSISEIESPNPRMFSLQKLVELADFNMDRIRFVWTRIWNVLAQHFIKVGCSDSLRISMWAIDALKQLASKFLSKKELANYHFQKEFLKPFELIMAHNSHAKIRDMVIRCLTNMIVAQSSNIKSGWKSIFVVFTVAASDHDEAIVHLAFQMVQEIMNRYFHLITDSFFVDCANCLVAYGNNQIYIDVSLKSVELLAFCAKQLAEGLVTPLTKQEGSPTIVFTDNDRHLALWFPILTGLSGIASHSHVDVRIAALKALFGSLNQYGSMFNNGFWELIFRGVLLPIFDNARHATTDLMQEDNEWLTTTCLPAFNFLIELFTNYFGTISFLLQDIIQLFTSCILQDNESLARIGATCFLQLVMSNGPAFSDSMWTLVCSKLGYSLEKNSPREVVLAVEQNALLTRPTELDAFIKRPVESTLSTQEIQPSLSQSAEPTSAPIEPSTSTELKKSRARPPQSSGLKVIRGKCTVQLGLLEALNELTFTHYTRLTTSHLVQLLDSLQLCYRISDKDLLQMRPPQSELLELLIREETTAVNCALRILFRMYTERSKEREDRVKIAEERLISKCLEILSEFASKSDVNVNTSFSSTPEVEKVMQSYIQIVLQILTGLYEMQDEQFSKHLPHLYPHLSNLILSSSKEIRSRLKDVFVRAGKLKGIMV